VKKVLILSSTVAIMLFTGCTIEVVDTPKPELTKAPVVEQEVITQEECNDCQDEVIEEKKVVVPVCPKATKIVRYTSNCKDSSCGFPVTVRDEVICNKGNI